MEASLLPASRAGKRDSPIARTGYYKSDGELRAGHRRGHALREYKMIVDSGFLLHARLIARSAVTFDRMVPPASFARLPQLASANQVDILNHAIEGLTGQIASVITSCWGSWPGPHTSDVPLKDIVDLILKVKVGAYVIEVPTRATSTSGRSGGTRSFHPGRSPNSGRYQPRDQCDRASRAGRRTHRAARQDCPGAKNVIAGTDCGFAQGPLLSSRSSHGHVGKT